MSQDQEPEDKSDSPGREAYVLRAGTGPAIADLLQDAEAGQPEAVQAVRQFAGSVSRRGGIRLPEGLTGVVEASTTAPGLPSPAPPLVDPEPPDLEFPEFVPLSEQVAEGTSHLEERLGLLVQVTEANLAVLRASQEAASRSERFSRRVTVASVVIASASLVVSLVSLGVSVLR